MKTIAFILRIPNKGSCIGEKDLYARIYRMSNKHAEKILKKSPYGYDFGDNWYASITAKEVTKEEAKDLRKRSAGFCGYDWMIDNIRLYQDIRIVG